MAPAAVPAPATVASTTSLPLLVASSTTTGPLPPVLIFHPDIQGRTGGKAKLLTTAGWQQKNLDQFDPFCENTTQLKRFHSAQNV